MNKVILIGRLTKDPEVRYTGEQKAVAKFSLAIDRGKKDGKDLGADFPSIVCFGKTAEAVEKYCSKGKLIGISGKIQTGSYEKDGKKVYTTEVLAESVEFLSSSDKKNTQEDSKEEPFAGFSKIEDDDIPF